MLGLVADAHHLVDDLTPSLDADAPPIRAFEYSEDLAVRVTEAGSDLDLHAPRIRPAAGDPTGISAAVDVPNGMRDSRDVRTYTQVTVRNPGLLRARSRGNPCKRLFSDLATGPNLKTT